MYAQARTRDDDFRALLTGHYGLPPATVSGQVSRATSVTPRRAPAVALSADTGTEVLDPAPVGALVEEYVVDRPEPPWPPEGGDAAPSAPVKAAPGPSRALPPAPPSPAPPPATPSPGPPPASPAPADRRREAPPEPAAPSPSGDAPVTGGRRTSVGDDDLAADMQAILSGRKVYDPDTGSVRDRGSSTSRPAAAPPERPAPEARDDQAIFDRIKQSMEHANSFDLGTVELGRRFGGFDRAHDRSRSAPAPGRPGSAPTAVGPADFARDLEAINRGRAVPLSREELRAAYDATGPWSGLPGRDGACGASSLALSLAPERSTAMYDTGEHVLAAGDLYPDQLVVGASPGVSFSYGQIVAMADFYESVDQMLAASPAELGRLKALIMRNTAFYRDNRRDASDDVGHAEWDAATGGRYLKLADANYAHFSPAAVLGMREVGREATNRSRWEELHERAIREMQQLVLTHRDATPIPVGPLTTNAFADHFLTDAFAAGHVVNKEVVIERFRANFFSGGDLNAAARAFFEQVASRAYTGEVARRFSRLEPSAPLCAAGLCVPLHPNIRTAGMFAEVLSQAAAAEPVRFANLAVKIVHDKLNREGIEVVNDAGDPAWRLTGDGSLNPTSLAVMRRAVQQSVDDINDPAILASNLDTAPFLARVWRHVPRPTTSGVAQATRAIAAFTDPGNADLVAATADLISAQLDSLVAALVDSGRMRED